MQKKIFIAYGKPSHIKKNCTEKKKKKNNRANMAQTDVCFSSFEQRSNGQWYIDSGATYLICRDENYFVNLNKACDTVYMVNGTEVSICGKGNCDAFDRFDKYGCCCKTLQIKNASFTS